MRPRPVRQQCRFHPPAAERNGTTIKVKETRAGNGALFNLTGHWLRLNAADTQRRFTTRPSDQTPAPEPALHPCPPGASTDHDQLLSPDLPSGQTLVQELPQTPGPEQPAAVHSASTRVERDVAWSAGWVIVQIGSPTAAILTRQKFRAFQTTINNYTAR